MVNQSVVCLRNSYKNLPINVLSLLKVFVFRIGIGQIVIFIFVATPATEVPCDETHQQGKYCPSQHSHHEGFHSVLGIDEVGRDLWSFIVVTIFILHDTYHVVSRLILAWSLWIIVDVTWKTVM